MKCKNSNRFSAAAAVLFCIIIGGCSFSINNQPRPRLGSYATSTPGTKFLGVKNLGRHCYDISMFEGNGIVYTCRGGHIDITHLRIYADYTRYLYAYTLKQFRNNKTDLTFKLNVEPSSYYVKLTYPDGWTNLPKEQKERIAQEVALELGQYFTYTLATWHEILTFYGYKCMAVLPEEASAFSWEDIYSNLLGIQLGAKALADDDHGYNRAMTMLIKDEMEYLGIKSSSVARNFAEKMRGQWFAGTLLVNMVRRNMDVGFDDGFVTPILVPGVCENAQPHSIPIPKLDAFKRYGFSMLFEVEPKEFEKNVILKIVYPDGGGKRIELPRYLPDIMDTVEKEAIHRGYVLADPNNGKM
jgi:hypothetical protein